MWLELYVYNCFDIDCLLEAELMIALQGTYLTASETGIFIFIQYLLWKASVNVLPGNPTS